MTETWPSGLEFPLPLDGWLLWRRAVRAHRADAAVEFLTWHYFG
jgi:hypothetical protein